MTPAQFLSLPEKILASSVSKAWTLKSDNNDDGSLRPRARSSTTLIVSDYNINARKKNTVTFNMVNMMKEISIFDNDFTGPLLDDGVPIIGT